MTGLAEEAPGRRRPRAWMVAALVAAGLGAYVVAGNLVRGGSVELRRTELAAVLDEIAAAQPGGAPDGPAARLRAAGADLAAGRFDVTRRDRCAADEIVRYGAADGGGRLRVFLVRTRDGAEAHVYGEGGEEQAAAAIRDGQRADPRARTRADALAAMAGCGRP